MVEANEDRVEVRGPGGFIITERLSGQTKITGMVHGIEFDGIVNEGYSLKFINEKGEIFSITELLKMEHLP